MRTFRSRTLAGAAVLSVALVGAACSDADDAGTDAGQTQPADEETTPSDTEPGTDEASPDEASGEEIAGRVGATYTANAFVLTGAEVAGEEGTILVVHQSDTRIRTAQTVHIDGEVVPFDDPQVQEILGDQVEDLSTAYADAEVVLAESVTVQE